MPTHSARLSLAAVLAWYHDMGVGDAVSAEAENWLRRPDRPPGQGFGIAGEEARAPPLPVGRPVAEPANSRPGERPLPPAAAVVPVQRPASAAPRDGVPGPAETAARHAARKARDLEELRAALMDFEGCALKRTAKNLCLFRGAAKARVMFVGEAPGREEDLAGKPFVGPAGQLLDKMLHAIGLDESTVHITNIVYWRPPGNRTPTAQEAEVLRPFLERQVELVEPEILVALGGAAAKQMLDVTDGIMRIRGKWYRTPISGRDLKSMAMLHPAYLLRTPAAKRIAWRDLLLLKEALAQSSR